MWESSGSQLMVESLLEILTKRKKSDVLQAYRCLLCNECCRRQYSFNMHVEYCESVKHDFSFGKVVNNLNRGKNFSDQMNRNRLDLILARCDRNCCTMEKLRCLKSAVNEHFNKAVWSNKHFLNKV